MSSEKPLPVASCQTVSPATTKAASKPAGEAALGGLTTRSCPVALSRYTMLRPSRASSASIVRETVSTLTAFTRASAGSRPERPFGPCRPRPAGSAQRTRSSKRTRRLISLCRGWPSSNRPSRSGSAGRLGRRASAIGPVGRCCATCSAHLAQLIGCGLFGDPAVVQRTLDRRRIGLALLLYGSPRECRPFTRIGVKKLAAQRRIEHEIFAQCRAPTVNRTREPLIDDEPQRLRDRGDQVVALARRAKAGNALHRQCDVVRVNRRRQHVA